MERTPQITDTEDLDSCVAKFLARHGVGDEEAEAGETAAVNNDAETVDETLRQAISTIESASDAVQSELSLDLYSEDSAFPVEQEDGLPFDGDADDIEHNFKPLRRGESKLTRERLRDLRNVANSISTSVLSRYQAKQRLQQSIENSVWGGVAAVTSATLTCLAPSVNTLMFWMSSVSLALAVFGVLRSASMLASLKRSS